MALRRSKKRRRDRKRRRTRSPTSTTPSPPPGRWDVASLAGGLLRLFGASWLPFGGGGGQAKLDPGVVDDGERDRDPAPRDGKEETGPSSSSSRSSDEDRSDDEEADAAPEEPEHQPVPEAAPQPQPEPVPPPPPQPQPVPVLPAAAAGNNPRPRPPPPPRERDPFDGGAYDLVGVFRERQDEDDEVPIAYAKYCRCRAYELERKKNKELCEICYFRRRQVRSFAKEELERHCVSAHGPSSFLCPKPGCFVRCLTLQEVGLHALYLHQQGSRDWWRLLLQQHGFEA